MTDRICTIEGCDRVEQLRREMCHKHYQRWKSTGSTADPVTKTHCSRDHEYTPENTYVHNGKRRCKTCRKEARRASGARAKPKPPCVIPDCGRVGRGGDHGLCVTHYRRLKDYGDPLAGPPIRDMNQPPEEKARRAKLAARKYRDANPEKTKARYRAYKQANWEKVKASSYRWREQNPERWYAIVYAARDRRRAAIGAAVERVDYALILAEYGMVCHICTGDIPSRKDLHFDHVIPLARGGPHVQDNIKPSHARCNQRKSDKLMSELTFIKIKP
jgi:hypothetical protein